MKATATTESLRLKAGTRLRTTQVRNSISCLLTSGLASQAYVFEWSSGTRVRAVNPSPAELFDRRDS